MSMDILSSVNLGATIEDVEAAVAASTEPTPAVTPFPGDPDATWTYWTPMDTAERGIPDAYIWERLRLRRDALLAACDFRVVADAPWNVAAWTAYRQSLRDLPAATSDPRTTVWPVPPEGEA